MIIGLSFLESFAGDGDTRLMLCEDLNPSAIIIHPSGMFVKNEQSSDEFSYAKFVDARDIPEMLEVHLESVGQSYESVQAVILDKIHGIDNSVLSIIYENFLVKCSNLRLLSLRTKSELTTDAFVVLCSLMRRSTRCVIDLSETEIRNKDVFPLLAEIQDREGDLYGSFESRIIFLRRNYLWDAENRVSIYKEKAAEGALSPNWLQRHKDFHNPSTGLGPAAKKVSIVNLPYPINLVFGVYSPLSFVAEDISIDLRFTKLSLNTADCSGDEEYNLTECSSVDSLYLAQHMNTKYKDHLVNIRYIWLEDCGVDVDVLRHLREGFLNRCQNLRVLSLVGNSIGGEVVEELINIWRTAPNCTFVLARNTFGAYQNGLTFFQKIKGAFPDGKIYEQAVQKIILMDESTLKLPSYLYNGEEWAKEKLWPSDWKERHQGFWRTYSSKRQRIPESLVSQDACE